MGWYEPKVQHFIDFQRELDSWVENVSSLNVSPQPQAHTDIELARSDKTGAADLHVRPEDSLSATSSKASRSTTLSAHAQAVAEAERAAIMARDTALYEKHALEMEEAKVMAELKHKKEKLNTETELATSTAKLKMLEQFEIFETFCPKVPKDGMNDGINAYLNNAERRQSRTLQMMILQR